MKAREYGFKESKMDGTEKIFGASAEVELPEAYTFRAYMPPVLNQGGEQICVPCTVSAFLNWRENLKDGESKDNKINLYEIYNSRTNEGEGMTYKDAFKFLRKEGVNSKNGLLKITSYSLVRSAMGLRQALVMNGPCFGALPVYNESPSFWVKGKYDRLMGYHAISIIGYDKNGFFIRNSWGSSFADGGYTYIKNEDLDKMIEVWTIVE